MPFIPWRAMPNVDESLDKFIHSLGDHEPYGYKAIGKAVMINPDIPESAAWDSTPLGKTAIIATAGIRNAADEMALSAHQAQAIARNARIASLRAYEALRSYQEIMAREATCTNAVEARKGPMAMSMYAPPTPFLQSEVPTAFLQTPLRGKKASLHDAHEFFSSKPTAFAKVGPHYDTSWCKPKLKKPQAPSFDTFGMPGAGEGEPIDPLEKGVFLRRQMEDAFANLRKAEMDATRTANEITQNYLRVRNASRAMTEALKLPGDPTPPSIPPVFLKPPKRPRDLAPFWLDVPYGIQSGADPYSPGTDQGPRDSAAETLVGVHGFNPFEGNVPMSEAGLRGAYKNVQYKDMGGRIDPGIHIPDSKEQKLIDTKEAAQETKDMVAAQGAKAAATMA